MPVVTIRGLLGSGAPEVGRLIADKLHVDYVDRQVIAGVATRLRRQEQDVIDKEMPPGTVLGRIAEALGHSYGFEGVGLPPWEMPLNDTQYLQSLESVIRELAAGGSMVLFGRGSQFILKDHPGALHVLVVAPLGVRVKRVVQNLKSSEEVARQEIARFDNSSREFVKRYFHAEMEDPANYDLVINTKHLSFEAAAAIALEAVPFKAGQAGG